MKGTRLRIVSALLSVVAIGFSACYFANFFTSGVGAVEELSLNKKEATSLLRYNINANMQSGKTDSVVYYILESDQVDLRSDPGMGISLNLLIADFFVGRGAYTQALKYRLKQLRYHELYLNKDEFKIDQMFCYGSLVTIYQRLGRSDLALKYLTISEGFANAHHDPFLLVHAYNNYGLHYFNTGNLSLAERYYRRALSLDKPNEDKPFKIMKGIVKGNLGSLYMKSENYPAAITYLGYNIESATENDDSPDLARTLIMIGEAYSFSGKNELAEKCLKKAENLIEAEQLYSQRTSLLSSFLAVYGNTGDVINFKKYDALFRKARETELKSNALALNDALTNLTDQRVAKLEAEKKGQQDIARQAGDLAALRSQRLLFILMAAIGIIASLLLYYRRKGREMERLAEMQKTKEQVLQLELQRKELEQLKLDAELKSSQQDLTQLALNIKLQEQIKQTLLEKLQLLKDSEYKKEIHGALNEMLSELNKHIHDSQGRTLQAEHISTVNDAFYTNLQQKFPKLTKGEVEFCGLIRMKIGPKEIATLKNISTDSVKITRHRLRKKLELSPEQDLYKFIESL